MTGVAICTPGMLKRGDVFTYVGAFDLYVAITDAAEDPTFPGRCQLRVGTCGGHRRRHVTMDVRLRAEQPCIVVGKQVKFDGIWREPADVSSGDALPPGFRPPGHHLGDTRMK